MNGVNKTLYIPLYGKAAVSKKGIILSDKKAEAIWEKEGFALHGKAASKWLTYYMGMRSAVFDGWLKEQLREHTNAQVLHIGCGMDSRSERVGTNGHTWYDVDFPDVIAERRRYYSEGGDYRMLAADARELSWLFALPEAEEAIVVMEGVGMYFKPEELRALLKALAERYKGVSLLLDCYSVFAARASKYKNPVNEVGVTKLYGVDDPQELTRGTGLCFAAEHELTPERLINELSGFERLFFRRVLAGAAARRMYRLYELRSC